MRVGVWMPNAMPFGLERDFFLDWVRLADQAGFVDLPPGGGHRGYAAVVDGSRLMVACCCSHSMGDR
jgi:hypothetical protein